MALVSRTLYPTLAQCRYLNQASLGLVSRPAVEAMRQFLEEVGQHGNLHMTCVHAPPCVHFHYLKPCALASTATQRKWRMPRRYENVPRPY